MTSMSSSSARAGSTAMLLLALGLPLALPQPSGAAEAETPKLEPRVAFTKPSLEALAGGDLSTLVVKLQDGSGVAVVRGRLEGTALSPLKSGSAIDRLAESLTTRPGLRIEPLFGVPADLLDALRRTGERRTGVALADLSQFFVLHLGDTLPDAAMLEEFLDSEAVETVYSPRALSMPMDVPPITPNFENSVGPGQGYRGPAPLGIDVDAAWIRGLRGDGVTIVDVENSWNLDHEDLHHLASQNPPPAILGPGTWSTSLDDIDHGTATLGVLTSGDNGYGTTGLVPDATVRVMPVNVVTDPTWNGANSVVLATLHMDEGDVLLIEAQKELPSGPHIPFEAGPAEYAAVSQATALGIHVIQPAANSPLGLDLDIHDSVTNTGMSPSLFDRYFRDSGAVLVGGGSSTLTLDKHTRYPNSNYGSRVDTYAWGEDVVSLGYGPRSLGFRICANPFNPFWPAPDQNQHYTYCYSGTSSAGAIVAGAAALLEQKHRADFGQPFKPRELRNLLSLGTPSIGRIGHQPALGYQLDFLENGGLIAHLFEAPHDAMQPGPELGRAVAGGGDVDGDGIPDVLVGMPGTQIGGQADVGRVYVFSGATGAVIHRLDGNSTNGRFGAAVALAGDADGDGSSDVVVGSPGDTTLGIDAGRVDVYTGTSGVLLRSFYGQARERYGASVAFVGNINPSGPNAEHLDDILIGAPGANSGAGRAEVRNIVGWTLHSSSGIGSDEHGFAVAGAGDLDADGIPDLLIGAPGAWNGSTPFPSGEVLAYSGRNGNVLLRSKGNDQYAQVGSQRFGAAVDGVGDFDGDGSRDIVVGAPDSATTSGNRSGRVDVLSTTGGLIGSFYGGNTSARLGTSVAGVGDFDGDGLDDVAMGSPNTAGAEPGRVRIVLGKNPDGSPGPWNERIFRTLDQDTEWGASVAAAGDVNGDGRGDLIAGEPFGEDGGRAYVFTVGPRPNPYFDQARLTAYLPVIEAHDPDGDGWGGGWRSPSFSRFTLDAGRAWAGADYRLIATPDVGTYLTTAAGSLDGKGMTSSPIFGPIHSSLSCGAVGARFNFLGAALKDLDNDGRYDAYLLSNPATVEIINEYQVCQ